MTKSTRKRIELNDHAIVSNESTSEIPNLAGDWFNFYMLILLYILQGLPLGLSAALPMILQSKKMVTYEEQAIFSVVVWPYCLKLLWAPFVDALYVQRIGRRKSWLIPLQLFMGGLFIYLASNIEEWLPEVGKPNLKMLVATIFIINFLSATQDIVVDGWALTSLKKKNVGYASTCNSVGLPLGMLLGNVCFTLLVSEEFWNAYFRTTPRIGGLITMKSFLYFFGFLVLLITLILAALKKEKDMRLEPGYVEISVYQNYKLVWDILKMHHVKILALALLSAKIGFTAVDSVSNLKLIDSGVSKDEIMVLTIFAYGFKIILPVFVSKYTSNAKPMSYYLKITPIRLLWAIKYAFLIYLTPRLIYKNGVKDVPLYYYLILGVVCIINEMMNFFMLLALFAFFCRKSDPRYGGTYMTLFNTFYLLGHVGSNSIILKLVSMSTLSRCSNDVQNFCSTADFKNTCKNNGGKCEIYVDGYYVMIGICMVAGFAWYFFYKKIIKNYELLSLSHWMVNVTHYSNSNDSKEMTNIHPAEMVYQ